MNFKNVSYFVLFLLKNQEIMIGFRKNAEKFSAIILAAGKSSRMGFQKLMLMHSNEQTFLERFITEYNDMGCSEIVVVVNKEGSKAIEEKEMKLPANVKLILNNYTDWGRFYSLKIAAKNLEHKGPVFMHNIDNPFVNQELLKALAENLGEADFIAPTYMGRGGHPILISAGFAAKIANESNCKLNLKEYLAQYNKKKMEVKHEHILLNINTQEEYKKWLDTKLK